MLPQRDEHQQEGDNADVSRTFEQIRTENMAGIIEVFVNYRRDKPGGL